MKRKYGLLFSLILLLMVPTTAYAQLWTGIIDPSRAIDWSKAGIPGGIPNRTTICATLNPGATSATINSAIASCPANQVVFLNAGTYSLSAGINFTGKSNVTLRGAGPDATIIDFTAGTSCGGNGGDICVGPSTLLWYGSPQVQPGGSNAATWSGGYSKGTTQITLSNVGSAGISVGTALILDQANDTSDTGGVYICDIANSCNQEGSNNRNGRIIGGVTHSLQQLVTVTAINGSSYTISPGLYANNWRAGQSPGAWWIPAISQVGIEHMTVDHTNSSTGGAGIYLYSCHNCWVKDVKSLNANRNHVWLFYSAHDTVRDNYFYGTKNAASSSYGVEVYEASDHLIENNIFQHVTAPIMFGQSAGTVVGYNYALDNYYTSSVNWLEASSATHNAGNEMNLFEGNELYSIECDTTWGTGGDITLFRNQLPGRGMNGATLTSLNTNSIILMSHCRGYNIVGNALGTSAYHTTYEAFPPNSVSSSSCDHTVYQWGWGGTECGTNSNLGVPDDTLARSTSLRWGNYDTVNASVQWNPSEIPTAAVPFINGNSVPVDQNLPASFYLSSKPSWWGTVPWPAIGPDVTGGPLTAGHAYAIPAQVCYNNSAKDSSGILTFNANNCYLPSSAPAPPTNLTVVVQ